MRALTVRQPWAWAIMRGGKDVENRTRNIAGAYRGPVAIHTALTAEPFEAYAQVQRLAGCQVPKLPDLLDRLGVVLGVVELVDVHECDWAVMDEERMSCCLSRWAQYPPDADVWHHLILANPRPLAHPIPWRGAQGLWTVPADLEAAIREQVTL